MAQRLLESFDGADLLRKGPAAMTSENGLPQEAEFLETTGFQLKDNGGTRSGVERRTAGGEIEGNDRRSGRDRRRGFDRRSGIDRRRASDRRSQRFFWEGGHIERRDAFRRFQGED
jgi:hypothetical protein